MSLFNIVDLLHRKSGIFQKSGMSVIENLQDPKELKKVVAAQVSASTYTQVQQKEFLPMQTNSLIS